MTGPEAWHLAQVNIALPTEPLTSERLSGFVALLDPVNALAEAAPGFVWRLQSDEGDATAITGFGDDRVIINLTVWRSLPQLADFVYGSFHVEVMRRRREWFDRMGAAYTVAWWIPAGTVPTVADAEERLELLRRHGPHVEAFTLQRPFDPPSVGASVAPVADPGWLCPA